MKTLFVHGHKFKTYENKVYTTGSLNSNAWDRYLKVFDSITVVGRDDGTLDNKTKEHYSLSSSESVSFCLLPDIYSLKNEVFGNKSVHQTCKQLIASHDTLIARMPSKIGYLFIKEAIKQKKPYAVEVVGSSWDALWNYGTIKAKLYAPLSELRTKWAIYNAPYATYVTESFLQKRYPCRGIKKIACSNVEIDSVDKVVLENRLLKISNQTNTLTFGLIGNYSADYKGIDIAIKALSSISQDLGNWELQVVGSGDPSKYLKLIEDLGVAKNINFIGKLPSGNEVFHWLDSIDFYLQPSLVEGLPRALIEAMSRGCPAVGSNVGGIPELLNIQQICRPGDHEDLARRIDSIVNKKDSLSYLANQNFDKATYYYKHLLNERRHHFWKSFHDYIADKHEEV